MNCIILDCKNMKLSVFLPIAWVFIRLFLRSRRIGGRFLLAISLFIDKFPRRGMFGFSYILILLIVYFTQDSWSLLPRYDTLPKFSINIIGSLIQDKYCVQVGTLQGLLLGVSNQVVTDYKKLSSVAHSKLLFT